MANFCKNIAMESLMLKHVKTLKFAGSSSTLYTVYLKTE